MLVLEYKFTPAGYVLLVLGCIFGLGGLGGVVLVRGGGIAVIGPGLIVGGVMVALAFVMRRASFPCPSCKVAMRPERTDKIVQCKKCGHQVVLRAAA